MEWQREGAGVYTKSVKSLTYPVNDCPGEANERGYTPNEHIYRYRESICGIIESMSADKKPCEPAPSLKSILKGDSVLEAVFRQDCSYAKSLGIKPIKKADGYVIDKGVLLRYKGAGGDVIIPEGVIWIWKGAFSGCTNVTSVTIPEGVITIHHDAFNGCSGLKNITLPSSCERFSLDSCDELEHIDVAVSNRVFRVEGECLITRRDERLVRGGKNSKIPAGVKTIENGSFFNCKDLKSVTIPDGVKTIGWGSFRNCKDLKSVTIPASVNSIGSMAFWGCSGLEQIIVASETSKYIRSDFNRPDTTRSDLPVENYSRSKDNCIINDRDTLLFGCKNSKIPVNVRSICGAFVGCSELKRIKIPKNVEWIDEIAFYGCTELEQFDVAEDNLVYRGEGSFLIARKTDTLVACGRIAPLPARIAVIGAFAFAGRNELKELIIPDGVGAIDDYAYLNCKELTSVVIPASVTKIGRGAFEGCSKLTNVEIRSRTLGGSSHVFYGCSSLSFVTIPKNLKGGYLKQKDFLREIGGNRFKSIKFTFTK